MLKRPRNTILLALLAALALAGCAGAGAGFVTSGLAIVALLGLVACASPGAQDGCDGQVIFDCSGNQVCCPTGVACNYWCSDASTDATTSDAYDAVETIEAEVLEDARDEADATCDGTWESACREGRVVQLCCPVGLACNYGQTMIDCGDGACVDMPATCPE